MGNKIWKIYEINKKETIKAISEDGEELIIQFYKLYPSKYANVGNYMRHCEHGIYDLIEKDRLSEFMD